MKRMKKIILRLILTIMAIAISQNLTVLHASADPVVKYDIYGWGHCYIFIYGDKSSAVQSGSYWQPEILEYAVWGRWANSTNGNLEYKNTTYCTDPTNIDGVDEPKLRYVSGPDYGVKVNGTHIYSGNTNWVNVPVNEDYYYSGGNNNGTILRQSIGQSKYETTKKDLFCFSFEITKNKGYYTAWKDPDLASLEDKAYTTNEDQTTPGNGSKTYLHFNYFPKDCTYLDYARENALKDEWTDHKAGLLKYCQSLDDVNKLHSGGNYVNYNEKTTSTIYVTVHSDQLGIKAYLNEGVKPENDTPSNNRTCGILKLEMRHDCQFSPITTAYGECSGSAGYFKCTVCGYTKDAWDTRKNHNYNTVWHTTTNATCTEAEKGYNSHTCANNSSHTYNDAATTKGFALGHNLASAVSYQYATNNGIENGLRYKNCGRNNNGTICTHRLETAYKVNVVKGANVATVTNSFYAAQGQSVSLSATANSGYKISGWTGYTTSSSFTMPSKAVTMQANATIITYTISYNLNGGTNNSSNPTSYTVENTVTFNNPTRTGYDFQGWYTDSNFTNKITSIPKGSTGNKNLYAKWKAKIYTISYNLNGGTNNSSNPSGYTIEDTVTFNNPTRAG